MRVLVNLTWLVPGTVGGSEESTTDAIRALLDHEPSIESTLAVLPAFAAAHPDLAEACPTEVLDLSGASKLARVAAEQTWLARRTKQIRPDVVHHAGGIMPLRHPGATVLTVHDLQPLELPQNFSLAKRSYIKMMIGRSARAADVVAVPSHFTASRVVSLLEVPRERVQVVPWSVVGLDRAGEVEPGSRLELTGEGPLFVYPAITYPHKNQLVLLEAFAAFRASEPEARLVLAGGAGPCESEVLARMARRDLAGAVERPGRVSRAEMDDLYRRATAVLVPSRYEGFGLPALEAMSRGVPLLVADAGSLPEVVHSGSGQQSGGPWATPVAPLDPDDPGAWAEAMTTVSSLDESGRAEVARVERQVASNYNPQRTARSLADAYRRAVGEPVSTGHPPTA